MSNLYCPGCGHKNIYNLHIPKFCNSCGSSFQIESQAKVAQKTSTKGNTAAEIDEDESDIDYVPEINKLQYEVSHAMSNVFKGKDILGIEEEELNKITKSRGEKKKNKVRRSSKRN